MSRKSLRGELRVYNVHLYNVHNVHVYNVHNMHVYAIYYQASNLEELYYSSIITWMMDLLEVIINGRHSEVRILKSNDTPN